MTSPLQSLIATGTKLWLDSIDPELVVRDHALGATGATSNPIIIADLIKTGRFDEKMAELIEKGLDDEAIAWEMTDQLVQNAMRVFAEVYDRTAGDDGYVSFELDPLLEDPNRNLPQDVRIAQYVSLAKKWSAGHANRMMKVPATPAGLGALEQIAAAGITVNVTLIFSSEQYQAARDALWAGAQKYGKLDRFKSVYSIFVSRLDVYTEKACPTLSKEAQGMVGIVNAKRIWAENQAFWAAHPTKLHQEMIFASTGTKKKEDPAWKYVDALAGSDIQTNPPATNAAIAASGRTFTRQVDKLPAQSILDEIDAKVSMQDLEKTLMEEGVQKFADPQRALLKLIADRRAMYATKS